MHAISRQSLFLPILAAVFLALWILSAVSTVTLGVWALENVLVLIAVIWVAVTFKSIPLSNLAYVLIVLFLVLHEVGAHYTYEKVPFGNWLRPAFGFSRNNYDRIVHFAFGLLITLPAYEIFQPFMRGPRWLKYFQPVLLILFLSAGYEIVEAYSNLVLAPYTAAAYLSSQGDPFDSENDMAAALAGALICTSIIAISENLSRSSRTQPDSGNSAAIRREESQEVSSEAW